MCIFDSIAIDDTSLIPIQVSAIAHNWEYYYDQQRNVMCTPRDLIRVDPENNYLYLLNISHYPRQEALLHVCKFFKQLNYCPGVPVRLPLNKFIPVSHVSNSHAEYMTPDDILYFLETLSQLTLIPDTYNIIVVSVDAEFKPYWYSKEEMLEWCEKCKTILDTQEYLKVKFGFNMFSNQISTLKRTANDIDMTINLIESYII